MGGGIKQAFSNPGRIGMGLLTGGFSEINRKVPGVKQISSLGENFINRGFGQGGSGGGSSGIDGKQNAMEMLTSSGGAPLLTNIALGADVGSTLMGYFGASGNYNEWYNNLNEGDQNAVKGLHDQLSQIQTNTELRNHAVQKLADDFPNIMAQKIPQYSSMADSVTQQMMTKAMDQISAKQSAGGMFSSGATAAAAARAGADIGMQKLQFGAGLAGQDFMNQFNNASALQSFQQKMLGQGATQGFNAVQNALSRNAGLAETQAKINYQQQADENQKQAGMWGALGQLGGTALGGMFGGPIGAGIGGQIGGMAGSGMSSNPRLNVTGTNTFSPRPVGGY